MSSRGKKDCKNCGEEIGGRCQICPKCAYHYPTGVIRQDLLDEKLNAATASKEIKRYEETGIGRKQCPDCNVIIGIPFKECPDCGFDFVSAKKKSQEEKEREKLYKKKKEEAEKLSPEMEAFLETPIPEPIPKLTHKEHAERILRYGKDRATRLLKQSKGTWTHVDWNVVREGLGMVEEISEVA